jgi:hypothetical protein
MPVCSVGTYLSYIDIMAWGTGVKVHFIMCVAICSWIKSATFLKTVGMRNLHDAEVVSVARFLKVLTKAFSKYYFCFSFEKNSFAKMLAILKNVADP